ncbi:MAG: hypothetical protein JSW18_02530 [Candidatus Omnitrophota bacterium]|nr:MAG: hypothetical protein JSW18_02530 [Candidatus Omnitrophota bacterium]
MKKSIFCLFTLFLLTPGCALKKLPSQALKTATKAIETAGKVVETTGKVVETTGKVVIAGSQTAGKAIGLAEKAAESPVIQEAVAGAAVR